MPTEYGRLLGDWRVSFIGRWQQGSKFTWTGGGSVPGVINNVDFRDSWGLDLRVQKSLNLPSGRRVQFFRGPAQLTPGSLRKLALGLIQRCVVGSSFCHDQ